MAGRWENGYYVPEMERPFDYAENQDLFKKYILNNETISPDKYYGDGGDVLGMPSMFPKLSTYADDWNEVWRAPLRTAAYDINQAWETFRPKYWDMDGENIRIDRGNKAAQEAADRWNEGMPKWAEAIDKSDVEINNTKMKLGVPASQLEWPSRPINYIDELNEIGLDEPIDAARKAAKGAKVGGARKAASIGMQGVGKAANAFFGIGVPVLGVASDISGGLNPVEATARGVADAGAGYAGYTWGGSLGAAAGGAIGSVVPIVGTAAGATVGGLIGGVLGAMGTSYVADKGLDMVLGDEDEKLARIAQEREQKKMYGENRGQSSQQSQGMSPEEYRRRYAQAYGRSPMEGAYLAQRYLGDSSSINDMIRNMPMPKPVTDDDLTYY